MSDPNLKDDKAEVEADAETPKAKKPKTNKDGLELGVQLTHAQIQSSNKKNIEALNKIRESMADNKRRRKA